MLTSVELEELMKKRARELAGLSKPKAGIPSKVLGIVGASSISPAERASCCKN